MHVLNNTWRDCCTAKTYTLRLIQNIHMLLTTLTHWGRVTHICVGNLTIIGSDNGLSPGRRQAIVWTNVGILLIGPLGTSFSDILIGIHKFLFTKMHLKLSSAKWRPFSLGLNVLNISVMAFCVNSNPTTNNNPSQYVTSSIYQIVLSWKENRKDNPDLKRQIIIMIYVIQRIKQSFDAHKQSVIPNKVCFQLN